eukprot:2815600-Rhodomonas_salina.2
MSLRLKVASLDPNTGWGGGKAGGSVEGLQCRNESSECCVEKECWLAETSSPAATGPASCCSGVGADGSGRVGRAFVLADDRTGPVGGACAEEVSDIPNPACLCAAPAPAAVPSFSILPPPAANRFDFVPENGGGGVV